MENTNGTLKSIGIKVCGTCGETRTCYAEVDQCSVCYADAIGHGGEYGCIEAAVFAVESALGISIDGYEAPERVAIAAYYDGCDRDCCHY